MADWGGFSEAELRHLRSGGDAGNTASTSSSAKKGIRAVKTTKSKSKPKPKSELVPDSALLPTKTPVEDSLKTTRDISTEKNVKIGPSETEAKEKSPVKLFLYTFSLIYLSGPTR